MKEFSYKELKTIGTYCGDEYVRKLCVLQEKKKDTTIRIVNTGMVSSGKSSLYNVLINSTEEYFPTGAARTTTRANYYEYQNISYIDTPGIDVRNEDDALAFSTIIEADIILMIHNIRTGPLNRSEVEWLEKIVSRMNSIEMCKKRLVFVLSWKDTREHEEDYTELVNNLKKQVFDITKTEIPFFEISVKKFQQGTEKEKDLLIKRSGILELKEFLEKYATLYANEKQRITQIEYEELMKDIKEILRSERDLKMKETQRIFSKVQDDNKIRKSVWSQVYNYFVIQRRELSDLRNELNNM